VIEVVVNGDAGCVVTETSLHLSDRAVRAQRWTERETPEASDMLLVSIDDVDHVGGLRFSGPREELIDLLRRALEAAEAAPVAKEQEERWLEAWHQYRAWREQWERRYANRRAHDPWWEGWWEDRGHVRAWCWDLDSYHEAVVCGDRDLALAVGEGIKTLRPETASIWHMFESSAATRERHAWDWPYDLAGNDVATPEQIQWRRSEAGSDGSLG
jgi:hypothetical protein